MLVLPITTEYLLIHQGILPSSKVQGVGLQRGGAGGEDCSSVRAGGPQVPAIVLSHQAVR